MKSSLKWAAAAASLVAVAAFATIGVIDRHWFDDDAFAESEEHEGAGPPDGDYWAVRAAYPTMKFEGKWLVDAAKQEQTLLSRIPAGAKTYTKSAQSPLTLDPNQFIPLGPKPQNNTQMSFGHVSGRANVIAVDPVDTTIAYFGSDGGGVWKTTNCCSASTTWAVKTDMPQIASISIDDLIIDPNNHNVVYAATGDLNYGSFSFGSAGVLKSTDQGETWQMLGADVFNPLFAPSAGGFPQYQAVGKIVVDPNNSSTLAAGTKTGIYFSYNAGIDWSGPCLTNAFSAQRQDTTGLIAVNNAGSTLLYAAIGTRGTPTPVQPDLDHRSANGVYSTLMPSTGCPASWALLNSGWPAGTGNGAAIPATDIGRIELAVAPSNATIIYAMAASSSTKKVLGVWRSANSGTSWTQTATASNVVGCTSDGGTSANGGTQMWYDARIRVHPTDPNTVYLSAFDLFRSTNGGASFANVTCGWGNAPTGTINHVHVDHHASAYVGNDPAKLLIGSDGGVFYSANATSATPGFTQLNDSINSTEFYYGDITSNFATSATPAIGAGAQDNGCSFAHFVGSPTGPLLWNLTCSGDGTTTKIEPVFNKVWFNSSQDGSLGISPTFGTAFSGSFSSASATTGGTWGGDVLSFMMSYDIYKWGDTAVPNSGCGPVNGCNHMIAGTVRLWETIGATQAATIQASWKARTLNLTKNTLILGAANRSYLNSVAYSYTDPTIAMAGSNDGNVQYVFGLGTPASANCVTPGSDANCANAVNVTGGNSVLPNRPILDVMTDAVSPLIGYAAVGGFDQNTPTTPGHVFRVVCAATCSTFTWTNKSGNLPNIPVASIMVNPRLPQQVFAGTDWGLYFTDDITAATPVWHRFEGLPHAMVWDLVVDRGFTTLAAFTRSRGAWAWPLPTISDTIFADDFED